MNKTLISGRLTNDPELKYLPNGSAVTSFGLAVDDSYTDSNGTRVKRTQFWRVTCWRKLAEIVNQYKEKGDLVLIEGQISAKYQTTGNNGEQTCNGPETWTDNQGQARASFEITAQKVEFMANGPNHTKTGAATSGPAVTDDDDIPF